jgi:glycosyltransferase involved in cell wall biosynthesis
MRHLLRLTDRMVDAIVVNSEAVARQLIEEERTPLGLIHLCRNGIDTREFRRREDPRPDALREAAVVVGTLCALRPEKNLPLLLRAFARVRRPGVKLAIVGSGPSLPELQALAGDLELGADCVFELATADVPRWLSAMDVFVLPSSSEALSNSLMEAMACGCAVAASNVGGNPELVRQMETGVLFNVGDIDGLADALGRLTGSAELRYRLAEAACDEMRGRYSLDAAAQRMAEIYERVMGR